MPRLAPDEYIITPHTADALKDRGISDAEVRAVLGAAGQVVPGHSGRVIYQSRFTDAKGGVYIIRAIVDEDCRPPEVITAYRTTQLRRYWRIEP